MFLGVLVYAVVATVTIDQMTAATTVPVDVIYGDRIAAVNEWDSFRNGVKLFQFFFRF